MIPGIGAHKGNILNADATIYDLVLDSVGNTNFRLCLDAGDKSSYNGGQVWTDRVAGLQMYLGSGSGAESSDPPYNGNYGDQKSNNYFYYTGANNAGSGGSGGGHWFTINGTNPSWLQTFHHTGCIFTIIQWLYVTSNSTGDFFSSMGDSSDSVGGDLQGFITINSGTVIRSTAVAILDSSANYVYRKFSTATATINSWNMLSYSLNMSTGNVLIGINSSIDSSTGQTFTGTPAGGNGNAPFQIGAAGGGFYGDMNGRISSVCMWDRALSIQQLLSIFNATRGKYGV